MTLYDIVMWTLFALMILVALRALLSPPRRHRVRPRHHDAAATSGPILIWFGLGSTTYAASESGNDTGFDQSPASSDWSGCDFGGFDGGGGGFDGGQ